MANNVGKVGNGVTKLAEMMEAREIEAWQRSLFDLELKLMDAEEASDGVHHGKVSLIKRRMNELKAKIKRVTKKDDNIPEVATSPEISPDKEIQFRTINKNGSSVDLFSDNDEDDDNDLISSVSSI
mmetsp:Transcript_24877/g.34769  ORF Transcript_24877/g.34769 Transcript_24877/m.34769 type:complete len:126 (+) Transcript_24877:392-769(+)